MSPAATVNGDSPTSSSSSAFLSHLTSYPLISDSLQTIQNNPYAAKGIALSHKTYSTVANPILPYLSKPYQYAAPYISKVDHIGDNTLSTIDEKFPVVKKPTGELYSDSKSIAFFPLHKGLEGKDYVFQVYGKEVKKAGGEGLVVKGKAAIVTSLLITSDLFVWFGNLLKEKKAEAKEVANEKM